MNTPSRVMPRSTLYLFTNFGHMRIPCRILRNLAQIANMSITISKRVITEADTNPQVRTMEYAIRGPLVIRAVEIEKELLMGVKKPFKDVIKANIGDAQAMGQNPISFIRQVISCVAYPSLIDIDDFPIDVRERAKKILGGCGGGSIGSYTMNNGIEIIRKSVAAYIKARDGGVESDHDSIFLSGGASESIRNVLKLFIQPAGAKKTGIMIPIPQYPLYSAAIEEFAMHQIGYYLDEDNHWTLNRTELERAFNEANKHSNPRVLCVINPGNPTGQVLSRINIEMIIKFAYENRLFLMADEVYQDNVYAEDSAFHSFKKVLMELGPPYSLMELASFHSVSKGYMGECGLRGGYVELVNVDPKVVALYKKMTSAKLCSTTLGQEKDAILASLKERAILVREAYDSIEGISCNSVQGAMYAFPRIDMPQKAIDKAKSLDQEPDFFYAMQLLEHTGVCIIPGSGFGQKSGTYHFRTTILPQAACMKDMLTRFKNFHSKFMHEYK